MYCVILPTTKVIFIFDSIQKATNTLNPLTNSICEIYVFYFSYSIVNFSFDWQINAYFLTYLPFDVQREMELALV